jgi:hypothetical protein
VGRKFGQPRKTRNLFPIFFKKCQKMLKNDVLTGNNLRVFEKSYEILSPLLGVKSGQKVGRKWAKSGQRPNFNRK